MLVEELLVRPALQQHHPVRGVHALEQLVLLTAGFSQRNVLQGLERIDKRDNLVDVILNGAANGSPAEAGWRSVELLDAAYRSAQQDGAAVTIESLYT